MIEGNNTCIAMDTGWGVIYWSYYARNQSSITIKRPLIQHIYKGVHISGEMGEEEDTDMEGML